jgi:hypothetical protein
MPRSKYGTPSNSFATAKTGRSVEIAYNVWRVARAIALGAEPAVHADPLRHGDEYEREAWAKVCAHNIVRGIMRVSERLPSPDQITLLRKIAELALWHLPNAPKEANYLMRQMKIEALKQPHSSDDTAPEI